MKEKIAIYLAGSIKKGNEREGETFWSENEITLLRNLLAPVIVSFLNPAFRSDDLSDPRSVFGRDMLQVFCSDVVLVDARDRRGLGVGAEMMWAKLNKIPVISWAPKDSHYHRSNTTLLDVPLEKFIHPFVESLSDHIADSLEDAVLWMQNLLTQPLQKIKGFDHIEEAMRHYKETQFQTDAPMRELISSCDVLQFRAGSLKRTFAHSHTY